MTEEIIIDGVNVAGCTYFQQEDDEYTCGAEECNGAVVGCRACDNCYYKQLKRLEQENKDLKKQIESDKGLITVGGKQQYEYLQKIDELEQENKELQEYKIEHKYSNAEYRQEREAVIQLSYYRNKYRSALEEIREIAEKYKDMEGCRIPLGAIKMTVDEVLNEKEL